MKFVMKPSLLVLLLSIGSTQSFQVSSITGAAARRSPSTNAVLKAANDDSNSGNNGPNIENNENTLMTNRRNFMSFSSLGALAILTQTPQNANAGIDVSGLRTEGGGSAGGNAALADQLKSYDGSASRRVQEIKATQSPPASPITTKTAVSEPPPATAATYALRSGGLPSLRSVGLGLTTRYEGYVAPPPNSKLRQIPLSFEFPSDWLQLDKLSGGIQYVDQRNGDKLYVLRATLPEGTTLSTVPKTFFGEVIFDPKGDIIRSGTVVDSYRVSRSQMLDTDCPDGGCAPHRRLLLKYETVTGSGVQTVERRGLVGAYEVDGGEVYMLMTSSNAVKFEAKGKERDTVENIVNSFRLGI